MNGRCVLLKKEFTQKSNRPGSLCSGTNFIRSRGIIIKKLLKINLSRGRSKIFPATPFDILKGSLKDLTSDPFRYFRGIVEKLPRDPFWYFREIVERSSRRPLFCEGSLKYLPSAPFLFCGGGGSLENRRLFKWLSSNSTKLSNLSSFNTFEAPCA